MPMTTKKGNPRKSELPKVGDRWKRKDQIPESAVNKAKRGKKKRTRGVKN